MDASLILFCLFILSGTQTDAADYGYSGSKGVSQWPNLFLTCAGNEQSPINIDTNRIKKEYWKAFKFDNYDALPTRMRIKNNGHSAQVEIDAPSAPRVSEGGLKGEYIFAQFHFHWGSVSSQGSEHTVDGVRYPMELHLVHYKAQYGSLGDAIKHRDGLAVLGVLFEVGSTDNAAFTPIVNSLSAIKSAGNVGEVNANYALSAYLPRDRENFYRYKGSLTTPTCNEVVIWTVFREPVSISETQLNKFRDLVGDHNTALVDNFRTPQPINHREVYASASGCDGGAMEDMLYSGCTTFWPIKYPTCGGKSQSPINIETETTKEKLFTPMVFKNYDATPVNPQIKNNGHSAQVSLEGLMGKQEILAGGLPSAYTFAQFHFHWGSKNSQGSEHTVDEKRYPMEMHLVHYRTSDGAIKEAVQKSGGLAVLGVFFDVQKEDNPVFAPIVDALKHIHHPHSHATLKSLAPLENFLPRNKDSFYRYQGSLTTPTCNEVVVWTVFMHPLYISQRQLDAFRELQSEGNHSISDNYRPVQEKHGRVVLFNSMGSKGSSASGLQYQASLLVSVILAAMWI